MPTRPKQSIFARSSRWLVMALVALTGSLEARTFTSTDGRTLEAEVVKIEGEAAVLKLANGRSVTVPFKLLVEGDQAYLKEWAKQEALNRIPRVGVKIDSNKRDTYVEAGYDERRGSVKFEIEIANEERGFTITGATATLVVIGEYLSRDKTDLIMQRVEFKDINIEFGKTRQLAADQIRYEYDDDDYSHGVKYSGYVFILRNASGAVVDVTAVPARLEKLYEPILKLKEGEYFNDRFEKVSRYSSSGVLR